MPDLTERQFEQIKFGLQLEMPPEMIASCAKVDVEEVEQVAKSLHISLANKPQYEDFN